MNVLYHDNNYGHDCDNTSYGDNAYDDADDNAYALIYGGGHYSDLDNPGRNRYRQR